MKRIFIAIKTTPEINRKIKTYLQSVDLKDCSFNPKKSSDYHITLVPPWNCHNIQKLINDISSQKNIFNKTFSINLVKIVTIKTNKHSKMLWVVCESNESINNLKTQLTNISRTRAEKRKFRPHINLGTIASKLSVISTISTIISWRMKINGLVILESKKYKSKKMAYNVIHKLKF